MKGNTIYYAIIILGVGAISYMYYLSDVGGGKNDSDIIDRAIEENKLTVKK
jgi:hypothetical protein